MSYKIIEKNKFGIRVRNYSGIPDCNLCKNVVEKSTCKRSECAPNSYYLPDSEVERLELENDLKAKNEELESRIKELEEEKTTELIIEKEDYYGCLTNITKTKCCGIAPITNENFCPNCGRKIIKK